MSNVDQTAREQIRNAFDETLIVEAAAGTGKTSELGATHRRHSADGADHRGPRRRRDLHSQSCR
jgi:hypothetical protein